MSFVEPTRRYPYDPRVTYEGRYGASLVSLLLGGYLLLNTNISQLALGLTGLASYQAEQTAFFLSQYLFAVVVVMFGFAVAPGATGRRVIAAVVVLVLILLWTVLLTARITGMGGPLPYAIGFVVSTAFIVSFALPLGWLIVRERPGVSYVFLVLSILGGVIPFVASLAGIPSILAVVLNNPLALVLGVGIAWLARLVAGALQRAHANSPYVDPAPPAV